MLFEVTRHEELVSKDNLIWDEAKSKIYIQETLQSCVENFSLENLWPVHKDEEAKTARLKSIYNGASGVLWGVRSLAKKEKFSLNFKFSFQEIIEAIADDYLNHPDTVEYSSSYLIGECGINLLAYQINQDDASLNRLIRTCLRNIDIEPLEAFWGIPGILQTLIFANSVKENHIFIDIFRHTSQKIFDTWMQTPSGVWSWADLRIKDKPSRMLGLGHGIFGNLFPLFLGYEFLSNEQKIILRTKTKDLLLGTCCKEKDLVNWPACYTGNGTDYFLNQWCHGAPGIVIGFCRFFGEDPEVLDILEKAGHQIYIAGPLSKGNSLCHGTAGNAYSFLALYQVTKDTLWLTRARQFAVHAMAQPNERFSLWTGKIGVAHLLSSCLNGKQDFPTFHYF